MSDQTHHPTIDELQAVLASLAHRVLGDSAPRLDSDLRDEILCVVDELERFIPGLDPPHDLPAAEQLASASAAALMHNRPRIALARALRGLSHAPHHAELHYLASSACFELSAITEAVRFLAHALWVNPGHHKARCEMDLLSASDDPDWWELGESGGDDAASDERAA